MTSPKSLNSAHPGLATRADVLRLLGPLDDGDAVELLAMRPTVAELEEAAAWLEGQADIIGRAGHPLSPRVAGIIGIVDRDDEEDPERR